ncbi:MAG: pitrilysin family protein, partial [Desulfomonilaceae bacterium]
MKILRQIVLVWMLLLILVSTPVRAAAQEVLRATLNNGLRVVIVKNDLAPVVTTEVNYLVGSNESPEGFPGMAHAQEHMLFRGSPGLSGNQLSSIMAAVGGDFNASTQQTVTRYDFTVPTADLDIALRVESIRMRGVLDSQRLWIEERGAIEQEVVQDLSNPTYVFYTKLLAEMYAGTVYTHDALGTRDSFQKTTGSMLKKFYKAWYGPNNAMLVIVGNIDPNATLAVVKRLFGNIPRRPIPQRHEIRLQPLKTATINLQTDLSYGLAIVAYRLPGYESPDYAAGQVLADVLASQRASLYTLVTEGKALSTDFSSSALPKAAMGYAEAAFSAGADGSTLISAMKSVIGEYLKNGIPEALVEAAKRHEVADAEFEKNSVSGLASLWSQAVAVEGRNSPDDDIEAIKKVTIEDVNRVAREYLLNDTAIAALLTPQPSGKPISSKGFGGSESFASKRTKNLSLPTWAKKVSHLPPLPVSTLKPTVTVLPNGLRLIVQPETISRTISVFGSVKNRPELEMPQEKEGVSRVLDNLFSYGTTRLDRVAFQEALDSIAATLSAGTSFSLHVLEEQFNQGVQLLSENILHPALPEKAFKVVQQEVADAVAGEIQSPAYLERRALLTALYPKNDPVLRQALPDTVKALTLNDVKNYYNRVFRPDMTTIVVIGRVTPEQAKTVVENYFGEWKATGPRPETDLPSVPPNKPSEAAVPDASRVQVAVTLAETLGVTRHDPDYYTLQLGRHILSGAFYASRLYRDLREKAGLVYFVDASLNAEKTRSVFDISYACDPSNVSKARAIVVRDLREMQKTRVSSSELIRAKTLLLHQFPLAESSTESIVWRFLRLALEDLPLDEPLKAAKRYRDITAGQIRNAFAKWIR